VDLTEISKLIGDRSKGTNFIPFPAFPGLKLFVRAAPEPTAIIWDNLQVKLIVIIIMAQ